MSLSLLTHTTLKSFLLLLTLLWLNGCATLNEKECVNGDWRTIGLEDGLRGAKSSRIGQHREACAEYSIKIDLDAYNSGREQGLKNYCKPGNGYTNGRRGKTYQGVCPDELEPEFLTAYKAGRIIYTTESEIQKLSRLIKKDKQGLEDLNKQLGLFEAELVSNETGTKRRVELLAELREMNKKQGQLENQIKNLELDQARLEGQVDNLKANSPY
jgi:hypothetical protein